MATESAQPTGPASLCALCENIFCLAETSRFISHPNSSIALLVQSASQCDMCNVILRSFFERPGFQDYHDSICFQENEEVLRCKNLYFEVICTNEDGFRSVKTYCGSIQTNGITRFHGSLILWSMEEPGMFGPSLTPFSVM